MPLDQLCPGALAFCTKSLSDDDVLSIKSACVIVRQSPDIIGDNAFIVVDNPRLAFAKALSHIIQSGDESFVGSYSHIDPTAVLGERVRIGNGCSVGKNAVIGANTEIRNNVVISENVKIGKNCLIKSNTVIGEEGFGFDFEDDGSPVRIPHIGSVEIHDNVEIGALNTVVRGTLKNTIVESYVKTDDHVHIAHNCHIGLNTIITACAELSGSVTVGKNCWLSPNCSIMNKITISDNCFIGLGAVVRKDTPANAVMVGNPAKLLRYRD